MNAAPKYIWLQDGGNYDAAMCSGDDLTWCQDKINDADTRYIRADLVPNDARIRQLEAALRECWESAAEHHTENLCRSEWSGSGIAQKKACAIAARSGTLLHSIKCIVRAALAQPASSCETDWGNPVGKEEL